MESRESVRSQRGPLPSILKTQTSAANQPMGQQMTNQGASQVQVKSSSRSVGCHPPGLSGPMRRSPSARTRPSKKGPRLGLLTAKLRPAQAARWSKQCPLPTPGGRGLALKPAPCCDNSLWKTKLLLCFSGVCSIVQTVQCAFFR